MRILSGKEEEKRSKFPFRSYTIMLKFNVVIEVFLNYKVAVLKTVEYGLPLDHKIIF